MRWNSPRADGVRLPVKASLFWVVPCCSLLACARPSASDLDASDASDASDPAVSPGPAPSGIEASPPLALVDLLYRTRARIAVSSTVNNTRDLPEHLVDHHADTAWNGKTGDLEAHVELRVPASARVKRLLLTVGYDRIAKEGDLFTMNHRLAEVTIERDGEPIGVFDLDPDSRAPQAIELDVPGGNFTVRPTRTVPGSRARYREIVISEVALLGTAPDDELVLPAMPQVIVGSLDRERPPEGRYEALIAKAPYPSSTAYCAREKTILQSELDAIEARMPGHDRFGENTPGCVSARARSKSFALDAPFTDVELVRAGEGSVNVTRLAVKTARGWYPTRVITAVDYFGPGCGQRDNQMIDAVSVRDSKVLVVSITQRSAYCMGMPESYEDAASFLITCAFGDDDALTCRQEIVSSFKGDCSGYYQAQETGRFDAHPPRWDWTREALVEDDGAIRLLPCVDPAGHEIACSRRNADLLTR